MGGDFRIATRFFRCLHNRSGSCTCSRDVEISNRRERSAKAISSVGYSSVAGLSLPSRRQDCDSAGSRMVVSPRPLGRALQIVTPGAAANQLISSSATRRLPAGLLTPGEGHVTAGALPPGLYSGPSYRSRLPKSRFECPTVVLVPRDR